MRENLPVEDMPVRGEPLALELVNTTFVQGGMRRHVVDVLTSPEHPLAWLRACSGDPDPDLVEELADAGVRDADLHRFRELRQALRELFTAAATDNADAAGWPEGAITSWSARGRTAAALARVAGCWVALLTSEERMLVLACRGGGTALG